MYKTQDKCGCARWHERPACAVPRFHAHLQSQTKNVSLRVSCRSFRQCSSSPSKSKDDVRNVQYLCGDVDAKLESTFQVGPLFIFCHSPPVIIGIQKTQQYFANGSICINLCENLFLWPPIYEWSVMWDCNARYWPLPGERWVVATIHKFTLNSPPRSCGTMPHTQYSVRVGVANALCRTHNTVWESE